MGNQLALTIVKKVEFWSLAMKTIDTLVDCCAWCFWDSVSGFFTFANCICCRTECRFTSFVLFLTPSLALDLFFILKPLASSISNMWQYFFYFKILASDVPFLANDCYIIVSL